MPQRVREDIHRAAGYIFPSLLKTTLFVFALITLSGCCVPMYTIMRGTAQERYVQAKDPPDAKITFRYHGRFDSFVFYETKGRGRFFIPRKGKFSLTLSHPSYEPMVFDFKGKIAPNIVYMLPLVSFPWGTGIDYAAGSMHRLDIGKNLSFSLHRRKNDWKVTDSTPNVASLCLGRSARLEERIPQLKLSRISRTNDMSNVRYLYLHAAGVNSREKDKGILEFNRPPLAVSRLRLWSNILTHL